MTSCNDYIKLNTGDFSHYTIPHSDIHCQELSCFINIDIISIIFTVNITCSKISTSEVRTIQGEINIKNFSFNK